MWRTTLWRSWGLIITHPMLTCGKTPHAVRREKARIKNLAPHVRKGRWGCCGNVIILLTEDDAKVCMEFPLVSLLVKETVSPWSSNKFVGLALGAVFAWGPNERTRINGVWSIYLSSSAGVGLWNIDGYGGAWYCRALLTWLKQPLEGIPRVLLVTCCAVMMCQLPATEFKQLEGTVIRLGSMELCRLLPPIWAS